VPTQFDFKIYAMSQGLRERCVFKTKPSQSGIRIGTISSTFWDTDIEKDKFISKKVQRSEDSSKKCT